MDAASRIPGPILCAPLICKVDTQLLEFLGALRNDEWDAPTVAPAWRVRDVAAHLLDTALRKLSVVRDTCYVDQTAIRSPQDLAALVNRLNHQGVTVYRRLSPPVLISLMTVACNDFAAFHEALDPFAPAAFAVSWAGEATSLNWFDTARELTERWRHQQQIRLATDRPGIMTPELYHPVLDCFMRGLPHAYRACDAPAGTIVQVVVSGECGGVWQISKEASGWMMSAPDDRWNSRVTVPQEIAWLIFTKGMPPEEANRGVRIEGDSAMGQPVLALTAIVA